VLEGRRARATHAKREQHCCPARRFTAARHCAQTPTTTHHSISLSLHPSISLSLQPNQNKNRFDFSSIAVLEPVITKLFFPPTMAQSQLPFWIIFSVTFVSRPFGGLVFAAVADLYGRKPCLLASVITMGVPSVLIGCLPTYQHIGLAAPILLALFRLTQGLALGGEYTAAVVTAYELSPAEGKNMGGAVAFAAGSFGSFLGVAVPMIVFASVSTEALFLWGWRIPFLVSIVCAGVALLLRSLMVEPDEFLEQRERDLLMAAAAGGEDEGDEGQAVELVEQQDGQQQQQQKDKGVPAAAVALPSVSSETAPLAPAAAAAGGGRNGGALSSTADAKQAAAVAAGVSAAVAAANGSNGHAIAAATDPSTAAAAPPRKSWASRLLPKPSRQHRQHRSLPVRAVFRDHWHKVALQCLFTAASTATVFTYSAWLPLVFLTPPVLLPRMAAYGMILITVIVALPSGLIAARFCDKGLVRPVTLSIIAIIVGAGVILAYFFAAVPRLATPTTHVGLIAATLTGIIPHNAVYGSLANVMGRIYPPTLRVTGFSTGHNLASSIFGGFAPIIMQALQMRWPWGGPAVYLTSLCLVSCLAGILMVRLYPGMNALPAEAEAMRAREREVAEAEALEAGAGAKAVGGDAAGMRRRGGRAAAADEGAAAAVKAA
jgi:MFS family permease